MSDPLAQFEVKSIIPIEVMGVDISYTNSALLMSMAAFSIILFFMIALWKPTLVPSRMQNFVEVLYEFINDTLVDSAGDDAKQYFPYIFSVFIFVLMCNLLGTLPYSFAVTSHIIVTFALAAAIFLGIMTIGFARHGLRFLSIFYPSGIPFILAPIIMIIEILSFLARPVSLSIRLAANMIAGHILLKVLAGFVLLLGMGWGVIPIPFIMLMTGFEIFVAILQAYIFTLLACVYLNDAINLH
jgi:F-type H+-transporting ATPase subunit a